jgi:hypothetical protein
LKPEEENNSKGIIVMNKERPRNLEICRLFNMMQKELFRITVRWVGYVVGDTCFIRMSLTQKYDPENLL